jgi:hypothetical protein
VGDQEEEPVEGDECGEQEQPSLGPADQGRDQRNEDGEDEDVHGSRRGRGCE